MGKLKPHICSYCRSCHQLLSLITVYQIFGPHLSLKPVSLLLSITSTFCIEKPIYNLVKLGKIGASRVVIMHCQDGICFVWVVVNRFFDLKLSPQHSCLVEYQHLARSSKFTPSHLRRSL